MGYRREGGTRHCSNVQHIYWSQLKKNKWPGNPRVHRAIVAFRSFPRKSWRKYCLVSRVGIVWPGLWHKEIILWWLEWLQNGGMWRSGKYVSCCHHHGACLDVRHLPWTFFFSFCTHINSVCLLLWFQGDQISVRISVHHISRQCPCSLWLVQCFSKIWLPSETVKKAGKAFITGQFQTNCAHVGQWRLTRDCHCCLHVLLWATAKTQATRVLFFFSAKFKGNYWWQHAAGGRQFSRISYFSECDKN